MAGRPPDAITTLINEHGDSEGRLYEDMERHNKVISAIVEAVLIDE